MMTVGEGIRHSILGIHHYRCIRCGHVGAVGVRNNFGLVTIDCPNCENEMSFESNTETVYATGGRGNSKVIGWTVSKENHFIRQHYNDVHNKTSSYIDTHSPPKTAIRVGRIIRKHKRGY